MTAFPSWRRVAGHWPCTRRDGGLPTSTGEALEFPITLRIAAIVRAALCDDGLGAWAIAADGLVVLWLPVAAGRALAGDAPDTQDGRASHIHSFVDSTICGVAQQNHFSCRQPAGSSHDAQFLSPQQNHGLHPLHGIARALDLARRVRCLLLAQLPSRAAVNQIARTVSSGGAGLRAPDSRVRELWTDQAADSQRCCQK
jgi:hypothetical protein